MTIPENVFFKGTKYLGDYRIAFRSTDGHSTEIEFHAFLTVPAQNPVASQFLDVTRFKEFAIDGRVDIVWGDREMCFPFTALYAGDLGVDPLRKKRAARVGTGPRRSIGRRRRVVRNSTKAAVK